MIPGDSEAQIKRLESMAEALLKAKRSVRPRRPIIIEFCGTPKAGKTSCISSLVIFLKRNRFKVKVLTERASVCPINDKFDPNFNVWTGCSSLAELTRIISNESKEHDVVILDRGIFDSVCWFHWQLERHHLSHSDYDVFRDFFLAERWTSKIDIVYILKASETDALEREYSHLLTRRYGSVMNPTVLRTYNESIDQCAGLYQDRFQDVRSIDTTKMEQNEVSYRVTIDILRALDELISEKIGYIRRADLLPTEKDSFLLSESNLTELDLEYGHRADIEANSDAIQPIPVAVIVSQNLDSVLTGMKSRRATSAKSAEKRRQLFYFGGHVRAEDRGRGDDNIATWTRALQREIKEELGLDYVPEFADAICILDRSRGKEPQHLAIATLCYVDFDLVEFRGDAKEFTEKGLIELTRAQFEIQKINTERWSQVIIQRLLRWTIL